MDDSWKNAPEGNVRGVRYAADSAIISDLDSILSYIKDQTLERPVYNDRIIQKIVAARVESTPLSIFSPWGPRYRSDSTTIRDSDPEVRTLEEISAFFDTCNRSAISIYFCLMPADVYATDVNGLDEGFVDSYFTNLKRAADEVLGKYATIDFTPWSGIISRYKDAYDTLKVAVTDQFENDKESGIFQRTLKVARYFNKSDPFGSAKRYFIERIVEGNIIEEKLDPVKLSLVRKEKDVLDKELKRMYIIANRAPWLGGE